MDAKPQIDPYYLWLGIPPAEQPPNHYRLLGVTLFEANAKVIDAAALRQTMHLRTYAVGPHSDHSQKLLNEVAAAKICLSRPEKKAAYDAELRARLTPATAPPPPPSGANPAAPGAPIAKPTIVNDPRPTPRPSRINSAVAAPKPPVAAKPSASPVIARPLRPKQTQPMVDLPPLPPLSRSQTLPTLRHGRRRGKPIIWKWIVTGGGLVAVLGLGLLMLLDGFSSNGDGVDQNVAIVVPVAQSDATPPFQSPVTTGTAPPAPISIPVAPTTPNATLSPDVAPDARPPAATSAIPAPLPSSGRPPPAVAPFSADKARNYQQDWAAHLDVPVEFENTIGMKFVLIPPGEFIMGSTQAEITEALVVFSGKERWPPFIRSGAPQHRVILTQPFYLGIHEVTQQNYEAVTGKTPSCFAETGGAREGVVGLDTSSQPVENVSWNDAADFCAMLSEKEQFVPSYFRSGETVKFLNGSGYRLPTEAQWEFACRGGTTTKYWTGDDDNELLKAGWSGFNSVGRAHAVGELRANPFGLFDMHGNVWEFVQDWWDPNYYAQFQGMPAIDPSGPNSNTSKRVNRGGDWHHPAITCSSSHRSAGDAIGTSCITGFRVALPVDAVQEAIAKRKRKPARLEPSWSDWPSEAPPPAIAPFDADDARAYQEAWAERVGAPVEYENTIGMKFVLIPPGEFLMGSTLDEIEVALLPVVGQEKWKDNLREFIRSEGPQHKVVLTQPTYLCVHEVTQMNYATVMKKRPSAFAPTGTDKDSVAGLDTSLYPVEMVNWNDAAEFCAKLSSDEDLKSWYVRGPDGLALAQGTGYRLPTEAEWEFACRGGMSTRYWRYDTDAGMPQTGWFIDNSVGRTHAVGELKANPFGLFDVHGNVSEWVQDWWEPDYYAQFQNKLAIDPGGPSSARSQRLLRGGNVYAAASGWRTAHRIAAIPTEREASIGFRVVLAVEAVKAAIANRKPGIVRSKVSWDGWRDDAPPPAIAPFDADKARAHQGEWAAHLGVPVDYQDPIGVKFVLIPPGEFEMGSTPAEIESFLADSARTGRPTEDIRSETPKHKVILTQAIYLGAYELTQAQYERVMGQSPAQFAVTGSRKDAVVGLDTSTLPIENLSWNDAIECCNKLSRIEKLRPHYVKSRETVRIVRGTGYRLPTEAEWEFACRAGTTAGYWTGDKGTVALQAAWFRENSNDRTHGVGELKANPFGLYDIHGNVSEWVQDWWQPNYYAQFKDKLAIDPSGPAAAGTQRVLRGGNYDTYYSIDYRSRASFRNPTNPETRWTDTGLRLMLTVEGVKAAIANRKE